MSILERRHKWNIIKLSETLQETIFNFTPVELPQVESVPNNDLCTKAGEDYVEESSKVFNTTTTEKTVSTNKKKRKFVADTAPKPVYDAKVQKYSRL